MFSIHHSFIQLIVQKRNANDSSKSFHKNIANSLYVSSYSVLPINWIDDSIYVIV